MNKEISPVPELDESSAIDHKKPTRHKKSARHLTPGTLFIAAVLIAFVSFVAGTRSDQIYAAVAPVFGVKASADTLDTKLLQQTYRELKANFDGNLDTTALTDGAARGMVAAAGDKYTVFMDAKEASDFQKELNGEVSGIGCEIGVRANQPTVLRVVPDSPAERAGLKVGDVFVSVNGESVDSKDAATVASKVRGDEGTSVKLVMGRDGVTTEYTITRAKVNDLSVRSAIDGTVGTLTITRFDDQTAELATKAAQDFVAKGVKSVIVDLRGNGGGYLQAAQGVASLWLNGKLVVSEKTGGKIVDQVYADKNPILSGVKTVVLVDGNTASASEILAGALQEYKLATLVGEKTFGKGTVQQVINLPGDRLLKVTVARWYTPNGKNITKEGITPDEKVSISSDDINAGRDPQLDRANELAR